MTFSVYVALGLSGECSEDTCQGCCLCHVMADQGFRIVLRVTHLHTEQLGFFFDKASQFFPGGQLVCPHDLVAGFLQNGQFMTEKGRSHNVFYDLATYHHIAISCWSYRLALCIVQECHQESAEIIRNHFGGWPGQEVSSHLVYILIFIKSI